MTKLEHALAHAARGFRVFPVRTGVLPNKTPDKRPALTGWQGWATTNPKILTAHWTQNPDANIGLALGAWKSGKHVFVLDIDTKKGKPGFATLRALEAKHGALPPTLTQLTASDGEHRFFISQQPIKNSAGKLGAGLDVRGVGGFVVGAGSTYAGGVYQITSDRPISDAPAWLTEACGGVRSGAPLQGQAAKVAASTAPFVAPVPVDAERARARAIYYLEHDAPIAIEGQGGDTTTYAVAAKIKDFGVSEIEAVPLLAEHWNPRAVPPWSLDELKTKVANAYKYGTEPPGAAAPEVDFEAVPDTNPVKSEPPWLTDMNARYFVVNESGRLLVYRPTVDHVLKRDVLERLSFEDFHRLHQNETVTVRSNKSSKPITTDRATAWLDHPKRRQYPDGVAFLPGQETPPGVLNLWRGYGVRSAAGNHSMMTAHVKEIVCGNDPGLYRYVMGWLARAVQFPGQAGEVALVLRGARGTGKGTFGDYCVALFGQHGMHVHNAKHLIGQFNAHLRDVVLLFADEAFYAGDRQHEAVLKGLVTDSLITIEAKYKDAVMARNVAHIVMASNDEWVVPAGVDERRFCVLDLAPTRRGDHAYFAALRKQMDADGLAAWLHTLQHYPLADFNVRAVPQTSGLAEQKALSLRGPEAWLYDCLQRGSIGMLEWTEQGAAIPKQDAYTTYERWSREAKEYRAAGRDLFSKLIRRAIGAGVQDYRPRASEGRRPTEYAFGPLSQCRAAFEQHIEHSIPWETDANPAPVVFQEAPCDPFN